MILDSVQKGTAISSIFDAPKMLRKVVCCEVVIIIFIPLMPF